MGIELTDMQLAEWLEEQAHGAIQYGLDDNAEKLRLAAQRLASEREAKIRITDSEWAAAKKLRNYLGERLERAAVDPPATTMAFMLDIGPTIESLERLLRAGVRRTDD